MRNCFKYSILAIAVISCLAFGAKGVCSCCVDCLIEALVESQDSCCPSSDEEPCCDSPCVITNVLEASVHTSHSFSLVAVASSSPTFSELFIAPDSQTENLKADRHYAPVPRDYLIKLRVLII